MKILHLQSSSMLEGSASREISSELVAHLQAKNPDATVTLRDLVQTELPYLDMATIASFMTPPPNRSPEQSALTELSDTLCQELLEADAVVLATPMYNFMVPARLKSWIDYIVRVGVTFTFTEQGEAKGLLPEGKHLHIVVATGGVPVGSEWDSLTPYLKNLFTWLGLPEHTVIPIDETMSVRDAKMAAAREQIAAL